MGRPTDSDATQPSRWEGEAQNWLAWSRTPDHDAFWLYAPLFFEELVPAPRGRTLEIGCGEGRVARELASRHHVVVGVDPSPTLIRAAADADPGGTYLRATGERLPFEDESLDLVVAYNVLMDVDDMPVVVHEAARVLKPDGHLCVCVTHPLNDAGAFSSGDATAPFVIQESYLGSRRFEERFERNGLAMTFTGFTFPLEAYGRAFAAAGLAIDRLLEPPMPAEGIDRDPANARWERVPMFLFLRAVKLA